MNAVRSALMRRITRPLVSSTYPNLREATDTSVELKRVLICRPNHRLGNMLLITPLVQEIIDTVPDVKIDLFVKGKIAPIVFQNYPNVSRIYGLPKKPQKDIIAYVKGWIAVKRNRYDLVINVVFNSSSGRIAARAANAKWRFMGETDALAQGFSDYQHMAKFPVYNVRNYLRRLGLRVNTKAIPPLDLRLKTEEVARGKKILFGLVENNNRTICIYTYATGQKCYSREWWKNFYERLKREYVSFNIVEILPVENVSQIDFIAPNFYSRNLREIGSVIANSALFIGADSGMMHLASSVHVPVVGLFQFENIHTYAPYGNGSFGINTSITSVDESFNLIRKVLNPHVNQSVDV